MSTTLLAPEKPLRFACNRCHSLKLRCPRSSELDKSGPDEPCSRCRKAGAPCIVSERGKVGRPAKRKPTPPSPAGTRETTSRQNHRGDFEKNQSVSGLIHVFGLGADSTMQQAGLSPPENILSNADSPALTPMRQTSSTAISAMASESSHENEELDSDKTSWGSHDTWPTGAFNTDPNFTGPESMLYEPFPQAIDLDMSAPTFHFPDSTDMFDLSDDRTGMEDKDGDYMFTTQFDSRPLSDTHLTNKPDRSSSLSISDLSRTSCLLRLSDLHTRMLHSSERFRSTAPMSPFGDGSTSAGNQIVLETVDFSGELIDATRQNLPSFSGALSSNQSTASSSKAMTPTDDEEAGDSPVPSAPASVDDWVTLGTPLPTPCIPESAVIFLLLGCYTQLLYSFEIAIDCFYSEYQSSQQSSKEQNSGPANSLLKASLSIHTVIYLLGRVHKAFATPDNADVDSMLEDEGRPVDISDWKRSLMGNKSIDEGLLGRGFNEIQEREQRLMRKATHLRQMINRFQF